MYWEHQWDKKINSISINKRRNTILPGSYSESPSSAMAIDEVIQKKKKNLCPGDTPIVRSCPGYYKKI